MADAMSGSRTTIEKVSDWKQVFDAVRIELTIPELRAVLAKAKEVNNIEELSSYMSLVAQVMANDRMAGGIAATLTAAGVRREVGGEDI